MLNQKVSITSEALLFRAILLRLVFSSSEPKQKTSKKLEESGPRARSQTSSHHAVHPCVGEAGFGLAPIGPGAVGASGEHTSGCVFEVLRDLEAIQVRFGTIPLSVLLMRLAAFRKGDDVIMLVALTPADAEPTTPLTTVCVLLYIARGCSLCVPGGGWRCHSYVVCVSQKVCEATTNGLCFVDIWRGKVTSAD